MNAKTRRKSPLFGMVTAAALSLLLVGPAIAADDTTVVVTGGSLGITTPPTVANFAGVTLDGTAKSPTAALDAFEVNDATGSGLGWRVQAQATQFDALSAVASHDLALGSLKMAGTTVSQDGTTSPVPTVNLAADPGTVVDGASPVNVATAAVDEGMGKYDFTSATFTLSLPASTFADTYTSTVTISTVSAPA